MSRLNIERQKKFEPIRMAYAKNEIEKLGYTVIKINDNELTFEFKGKTVKFFSYSGWASGAAIQDGRGLDKLLKQIGVNNEKITNNN
ncbi:MAG: hypothetical protein QQN41_10380 [Nitrosopumilus sp.]